MEDRSTAEWSDPVRDEQLDFSSPVLGQAESDNVAEVLDSGWITTGPKTNELESRVASRVGVSAAVGTTNCSSALYLACRALDIYGEVITSPLTFATTVASIDRAGATPVLADVRRDTLTLDPSSVSEAVGPETEAIMPVHYGGQAVDMDAIREIATDNDLAVIEDAAPALGASFHGEPAGSLGDIGCFSFHATKTMTTGEGGMLVTDDDDVAERVRKLRLAGVDKDAWERDTSDKPGWHYDVTSVSLKYNMNDIQAAVGIAQCDRLQDLLAQRRRRADELDERLAEVDGVTPLSVRDPTEHARQVYTVVLDTETLEVDRREFEQSLNNDGISTSVYYIPVHDHSAFEHLDDGSLSTADRLGDRILSLPLHPEMDEEDVDDIVTAVERGKVSSST